MKNSLIFLLGLFVSVSLIAQDPCDRQAVLDDYLNNYLPSDIDGSDIMWTGSLSGCNPGDMADAARQKVLDRLNYYRRLCGVQDNITWDATWNEQCQDMALMIDANNALDHFPPSSWTCYTSDGADAAGSSNIGYGNWNWVNHIDLYIEDPGSGNEAVGHRRWALRPQTAEMGFGATPEASCFWVIGDSGNGSSSQSIPYPPEGYVPAPLVYPRWSFSHPSSVNNANVSMTGPNGNVSLIQHPVSNGFGPNTVVWEPSGIDLNNSADVTYTVTITGIGGTTITYDVIIMQPSAGPPCTSSGAVQVKANVALQGGMGTNLFNTGILPMAQPYNVAPYNYNGTEVANNMPGNVVDWVLVELRRDTDVTEVIDRRAALLQSDGTIVDLNGLDAIEFPNAVAGENYYISVNHRTHLGIVSANTVSVPNAMPYDFMSGAGMAMGNNQQADNGVFASMVAGDYDGNGINNIQDFVLWFQNLSTLNEYLTADGSLDANVNIVDFQLWFGNASNLAVPAMQY